MAVFLKYRMEPIKYRSTRFRNQTISNEQNNLRLRNGHKLFKMNISCRLRLLLHTWVVSDSYVILASDYSDLF